MRWIRKTTEPDALKEWRSRNNTDINFGYDLLRKDTEAIAALEDQLLKEQGSICAYTGIRLVPNQYHVEHLKPQTHCEVGEDVLYTNVVACYPSPNQQKDCPYGAKKKDDWPHDDERHLFVSPLDSTCETRFRYTQRGEVQAKAKDDVAAVTTIEKLGLNHKALVAKRQAVIRGTLGSFNQISITQARQRLKSLRYRESGTLEQFQFVLQQVLEKRIEKLQYIKQSKSNAKSKSQSATRKRPKSR